MRNIYKYIYTYTYFWDSSPIACNLREASLGFPSDARWSQGAAELLQELRGKDTSNAPLQKLMYTKLISHKFGNNLCDTFERRLNNLFLPFTLDFRSSIRLDHCIAVLRKNRAADVMKVLKGWCNGWATSSRFHEDILLPCLFGCRGCNDDLHHYMQCPILYALWSFLAGGASADPLERWGLIRPNPGTFNYIACVYAGYHAVRRGFRAQAEFFEYNQEVLTGLQTRKAWSVFAEAFMVEARETSTQCRRFSLPSFLEFMQLPSFLDDTH